MKRFLAILLVLTMIIVTVSGCNQTKPSSSSPSSSTEVSSQESSSETVEVSSDVSSEESSVEPDSSEPEEVVSEDPPVVLTPEQQRAKDITDGADAAILKASIFAHEYATDSNNVSVFKSQNAIRVAKAIDKAIHGGTVTIAFFGGENTANSNPVESTYITQVKDWWTTTFPGQVKIIEAGYFTMSSAVADYRVRHDILQYKPDLVFVDFNVQDAFGGSAKSNSVIFENMVRRILECSSKPGVIVLLLSGAENTSYVTTPGNCNPIATASKYEVQIADHYKLPVIDFNTAVWDTVFTLVDKKVYGEFPLLSWDTFAQYNTALNDVGHLTLAKMIINYLGIVKSNIKSIPTTIPPLPTTFRLNNGNYMNLDMYTPDQLLAKTNPDYKINEPADVLTKNLYSIKSGGPSISNQCIVCYRPTSFMTITVPKVSSDAPVYFMLTTSPQTVINTSYPYSPIELDFYNEDGSVVGTTKVPDQYLQDAIKSYRVRKFLIPSGTVKVEYKVYVTGGTVIFNGLALDKPPAGITG